jgi:4-hydroxy-3-polyprenylbenzoate decarboxylase
MSLLQPEQLATGRTHGIAAQFTTSFPDQVQRTVIDRWAEYGFSALETSRRR